MALVTNSVHFVDSDVNTHFTDGILGRGTGALDSASMYADIQIAEGSQLVGGNKLKIESIRILSLENVTYRVEFWEKSVPLATLSLNTHGLLGAVNMVAPGGVQPSAYFATGYQVATLFAYIAEQLDIPYHDKSGQGQLHVNLVNISGTAKSANSAGAVHLRVGTIAAS